MQATHPLNASQDHRPIRRRIRKSIQAPCRSQAKSILPPAISAARPFLHGEVSIEYPSPVRLCRAYVFRTARAAGDSDLSGYREPAATTAQANRRRIETREAMKITRQSVRSSWFQCNTKSLAVKNHAPPTFLTHAEPYIRIKMSQGRFLPDVSLFRVMTSRQNRCH